MQWAFFRIPVTGGDEAIELNRFLRSVRVLNIHREFVAQGDGSYWAMSVEYLPAAASAPRSGRDAGMSAAKVDFKTLLDFMGGIADVTGAGAVSGDSGTG